MYYMHLRELSGWNGISSQLVGAMKFFHLHSSSILQAKKFGFTPEFLAQNIGSRQETGKRENRYVLLQQPKRTFF